MPSINKIAHGVVQNRSSVKDAVEKMTSTYAAVTGSTKQGTIIKTSIPPYISPILIIENADPSYKKTPILNEAFLKVYPRKNCCMLSEQLEDTYTSNSNQGKSQKKCSGNLVFLDLKKICRRPGMSQKNHSVLVKVVLKAEEFTDVKLSTLLEEKSLGARAQRFIKKDKSVLNTVKIDFPSKKTRTNHCRKNSS